MQCQLATRSTSAWVSATMMTALQDEEASLMDNTSLAKAWMIGSPPLSLEKG